MDLPGGDAITIIQSEGGAAVELICSGHFTTDLYSVGTDVDDLEEFISQLKAAGYHTTASVIPDLNGMH